MARHRLPKRNPQIGSDVATSTGNSGFTVSIINNPTVTASLTGVTFAPPATTFTVVTSSFAIPTTAPDGSVYTNTIASAVPITDPAQYSSILSSENRATSSSSHLPSASPSTSATATAAPKKTSSNSSTLIPAIVVPIVVVLLAVFAAFWFCMRRRHRKEIEDQPDIVMAGRGEKIHSETNSSRSTPMSHGIKSSDKALSTPISHGIKSSDKAQPFNAVSEVTPGQHKSPKYSMDDIGVARPMTPTEAEYVNSRNSRTQFESFPSPPENRHFVNFSGPRPATARRPPPSRRVEPESRLRSNSQPTKRDITRDATKDSPEENRNPFLPNPPRTGTSPSPGPVAITRTSPSLDVPRGTSPNTADGSFMRQPSPTMNQRNRANPPAKINVPPQGAYNGASPISQYSPIVKETPNIAAAFKPDVVPTLKPFDFSEPRSDSPFGLSGSLTEENMRIARLANSSRLGFTGDSSPHLPPPATRSQLIPEPSPREEVISKPKIRISKSDKLDKADKADSSDKESFVSAADDYEDIDAKSDASSINELQKFDFDTRVEPPATQGPKVRDYLSEGVMGGGGRGSPF